MRATGTDEPLRVVLVDSREERRALMVPAVEGDGDRAVVVAEADGPEAAVLAVGAEGANAVVLDVGMPVAEGLRALQALRGAFPALAIVVCSFDMGAATVTQALAAGADACLPKPVGSHDLVAALQAAQGPEPARPVPAAA